MDGRMMRDYPLGNEAIIKICVPSFAGLSHDDNDGRVDAICRRFGVTLKEYRYDIVSDSYTILAEVPA